jgi:hypothetical protein
MADKCIGCGEVGPHAPGCPRIGRMFCIACGHPIRRGPGLPRPITVHGSAGGYKHNPTCKVKLA